MFKALAMATVIGGTIVGTFAAAPAQAQTFYSDVMAPFYESVGIPQNRTAPATYNIPSNWSGIQRKNFCLQLGGTPIVRNCVDKFGNRLFN